MPAAKRHTSTNLIQRMDTDLAWAHHGFSII
jgi:hypothetical protein